MLIPNINDLPGIPMKRSANEPIIASVQSLSAVTLATSDMTRSVEFYLSLGFSVRFGGPRSTFTTLHAGKSCLNLVLRILPSQEMNKSQMDWGRLIFYVSDVDAFYRRVIAIGLQPESEPTDAAWGERYFHLRDPQGHSLSFAAALENHLT